MPADYHLHTPLCRHAVGEPEAYAARALAAGLDEIGFSDHAPMRAYFDNWRMLLEELDGYVEKVRKVRRDFPQLQVRLALEMDYIPGCEDWVCELSARHPWDYLMGSVHYISDSWSVDNPDEIAKWREHDPYEVWEMYFERLTQAAATGLFDIIGHADLPKKFGIYPTRDCAPLFVRFLDSVNNSALDINTAGLRKDCREIYPSPQILRLAAQRRIPVTFGSDAHAPEEVGMNFAEAVQLAREAGYTHGLRFQNRTATAVAL